MLLKDLVFYFIAVNFVVPPYAVKIGVCIVTELSLSAILDQVSTSCNRPFGVTLSP